MKTLIKKVRVEVTEDDIQQGDRGNGLDCPIHRAIQRRLELDGETPFHVSACVVTILTPLQVVRYDLPDEVGEAIDFWDKQGGMAPFAFTMDKIP